MKLPAPASYGREVTLQLMSFGTENEVAHDFPHDELALYIDATPPISSIEAVMSHVLPLRPPLAET